VAAAVYTYNGKVGYTILGNKEVIGDEKSLDRILKHHMHEELNELIHQVGLYKKLAIPVTTNSSPVIGESNGMKIGNTFTSGFIDRLSNARDEKFA